MLSVLVLGMCFFVGGTRFSEQGLGIGACSECTCLLLLNPGLRLCRLIADVVQLNSSLLTLSVIALLLPAAFHNAVQPTDNVGFLTNEKEGHDILSISHGVCKSPPMHCPSKLMAVYPGCRYLAFQSVLFLCSSHTVITIFTFLVYLCYLWFQLVSHKNLYDDNNSDVQQSVEYPSSITNRHHIFERRISPDLSSLRPVDDVFDPAQRDACSLEEGPGEKDGEVEEPEMGLQTTIALLAIVTLVCRLFISLTVWGLGGLIVPNSSLPSPLSSSSIPSTALLQVATLAKGLLASSYCQTWETRPVCYLKHRSSPLFGDLTWRVLGSRRPCHCYCGFSQTKFKGVSRNRSGFKYRKYWRILLSSPISTDSWSLSIANCTFRNSVRACGGHRGVALTPFRSVIVILGWILGKPLTLLLDPFESIVLFLSGETPTCYRRNPNVG